MFSTNNKISVRQIQSVLILFILAPGILYLPGNAVGTADEMGFVSALLGGAIGFIFTFWISFLVTKSSFYLPKAAVILISLWVMFRGAWGISTFCGIIKDNILFKTPLWLTVALMVLLCIYCLKNGVETLGRSAEILIYFALVPLLVIFVIAAFSCDFSVFVRGDTSGGDISNIFSAALRCAPFFSGAEILLLSAPHMVRKKPEIKEYLKAYILAWGILVFIVVILTARFGIYMLAEHEAPILRIMDTIGFPGSFIERQDILILGTLMLIFFAASAASLVFGALSIRNIITGKPRSGIILGVLLFCCMFIFSGCDATEISDRSYAVSIGIEKNENELEATLEIATLSNEGEDKNDILTVKGKDFAEITKVLGESLSKKIYLGHTKSVILGERLLSDREMLEDVQNKLFSDPEVNMRLVVLASRDDIEKIVESAVETGGIYIWEFFKNNETAHRLDLESMREAELEGGNYNIPLVSIEPHGLRFEGSAVMHSGELAYIYE
ncbi:MAG: GerAB/ArcD/ProY family transporter [Firmicutes bacterium]|nr:GerAB/ArcD/ProY family transporter [Bacillota bacterium]